MVQTYVGKGSTVFLGIVGKATEGVNGQPTHGRQTYEQATLRARQNDIRVGQEHQSLTGTSALSFQSKLVITPADLKSCFPALTPIQFLRNSRLAGSNPKHLRPWRNWQTR
ncbi:MAG: hypothetical protein L7U72_07650 [Rubripirellula sp.]|nr:hypothetical protein [Rubripirellula sp.]